MANDVNKRMNIKDSLRFKISVIVVVITLASLLLGIFVSRYVIESFFKKQTKAGLVDTYNYCNQLFKEADIYNYSVDEIQNKLKDLYNDGSSFPDMLIFIVDKPTMTIFYSVFLDDNSANEIKGIIKNYDFSKIQNKKYVIKTSDDNELSFTKKGEFMYLIGMLDDGNIIIIKRPLVRTTRLYRYVSKLFLIAFSALILIELIIVIFVSTVFIKPIIKMSYIAKRMSNLDFDAKIEVGSNDEIGILGNSMNELSVKLEKTISELKTANTKLRDDIEDKIQIDDMRKEFLSHVSHELKTPIALIQGYAEGLKDNVSDDPESREFYCDVIIDEAGKMNKLVMRLMNLNELEFGENNISIQRFDITELIVGIVKSSNIMIEQSQAKVIFDEDMIVTVWADEFMIEEVITNYLTNAIHYVTPGGNIRIWYDLDNEKNKIRVSVYNDGDNISDEAIGKVFIKFYKEDAARTREYGGSGIGLSIVETIMKKHNNDYGVYNVDGGVVFYFELDVENIEYITKKQKKELKKEEKKEIKEIKKEEKKEIKEIKKEEKKEIKEIKKEEKKENKENKKNKENKGTGQ
ncbi:Signal transduction histidine kinase [Eubacterium ruminantium]|uniref:histidine kinase n=1 Tax=Eubacterium ruminantium TaxID=42322 RepID=A0A1T4LUY7_9FIRM|nr:HAMP domain-containing sensor histidine kinase [Eubacterium ruminantium]SCW39400.1 Signal transduction histidine kinase [Eubacterium ruminantium]SDM42163.1 Signal transduction histidine kinase [Eubacterium ruminantium]SJZ58467.1 Signal transduction histidine kinase [Eubacterium ruminantium]